MNIEACIEKVVRGAIDGALDRFEQRIRSIFGPGQSAIVFLTTAEAAEIAKVTPKTIRAWVAAGRLARYSAGGDIRIARRDLDNLLAGGEHDEPPVDEAEQVAARMLG